VHGRWAAGGRVVGSEGEGAGEEEEGGRRWRRRQGCIGGLGV